MQIYLTRDGQQLGPFDEAAVRDSLQNGTFTAADLAWYEGAAGWAPLGTLPGMAGVTAGNPPPPPLSQPPLGAPAAPLPPAATPLPVPLPTMIPLPPGGATTAPVGRGGTGRRWLGYLTTCLSLTVGAIYLLLNLVHCSQMGTRYKVSDKESVNYSGQATDADARKLADALKSIGYFDNSAVADVLLNKEKGKTTVSFVVNERAWTDENMKRQFKNMGKKIADKATGHPLTVRLIDTKLITKSEFQID